jgi:hypothetical protein
MVLQLVPTVLPRVECFDRQLILFEDPSLSLSLSLARSLFLTLIVLRIERGMKLLVGYVDERKEKLNNTSKYNIQHNIIITFYYKMMMLAGWCVWDTTLHQSCGLQ